MPTARAVRIREPGDAGVLEIADLEVRAPGPGEVLVEVAAAGLNRADLLQRKGFYPAPPGVAPDVPGLEYAGTVADAGPDAGMRPGTRVMGITGGGAMATHVVVHAREAMRIPGGMSFEDAAAIPEAFLTGYDALFDLGELRAGEVVLIHAVGSGVGTAALQLALVAGATAIGTSRSEEKLERCAELGLEDGIVVDDGTFDVALKARTAGRAADVILDCVGGAYLEENVRALAPRGRLVVVGLLGGATGKLSLGALLAKRARVIGTVLRSRPLEEKAALAQAFEARMLPLFADGRLLPVVGAVLPMAEIRAAHEAMEKDATFGKIVLTW